MLTRNIAKKSHKHNGHPNNLIANRNHGRLKIADALLFATEFSTIDLYPKSPGTACRTTPNFKIYSLYPRAQTSCAKIEKKEVVAFDHMHVCPIIARTVSRSPQTTILIIRFVILQTNQIYKRLESCRIYKLHYRYSPHVQYIPPPLHSHVFKYSYLNGEIQKCQMYCTVYFASRFSTRGDRRYLHVVHTLFPSHPLDYLRQCAVPHTWP